jgi:hypothetical protein
MPKTFRSPKYRIATILGVLLLIYSSTYGEVMRMNDGREFECIIIAKSSETYCIKYLDREACEVKLQTVGIEEIASVTRERDREIARENLISKWNEDIERQCHDAQQSLPGTPETQEPQAQVEEASEQYCSLDFASFESLFAAEDSTPSRKDELWSEYRGKPVKWTGEITGVHETFGAIVVNFRHKPETRTYDVAARFPNCENQDILNLTEGQVAVYTGYLLNRPGFLTPWEVGDAVILQVHPK